MTAETMSEMDAAVDRDEAGFEPASDRVVRAHVLVAVEFLLLALVLGLIAAVQLVAPGFLGGTGFLGFGRITPMATNALLYGWLTIGLLGAAYYIVPRSAGRALSSERLAGVSLAVLAGGYLAGIIGIGLGMSEGRRYLEMPLWADAITLLGLLLAAFVITRTVAGSDLTTTPAQWFILGGVWWLVLTHVAGNVPGIAGVNSTLQTAFYEAALFGLWFAAAGIGVVYFVSTRLSGRVRSKPTQLAVIGFWSLAFVWAGTAPRSLLYGPAPDWLETVGALFSIGLIVPVAVVLTDLVLSMRGRWDRVAEPATVRFLMAGSVLFAVAAFQNLFMALRSVGAVVQFTQWVAAYEHLALYGAFSMWLFAAVYHMAPRVFGRPLGAGKPGLHYRMSLLGLGLLVVTMWVGGLQYGFTWVAGANEAVYGAAGPAFINGVAPFEAHYVVRLVGLALFFLAQLWFVIQIFSGRAPATAPADGSDADAVGDDILEELAAEDPLTSGKLRAGVVGLFALAALSVWILPSFERDHGEPTLLADTVRTYEAGSLETQGRDLYLQEGCWYCHTQEVRPVVTDVGLGPVSRPGDYVHEVPALRGVERIGPDLMHAGDREPTDSAAWVFGFLQDPASVHEWTKHPGYDHLSDEELLALAAYISALD